jgi:hypothetical protein
MYLINLRQQIVNWFNNRGANSKRASLSAPVFNFGGESRVSSELQIYSRMYYESRVKERVDLSLSGIQDDSSRLKIMNKCTAKGVLYCAPHIPRGSGRILSGIQVEW